MVRRLLILLLASFALIGCGNDVAVDQDDEDPDAAATVVDDDAVEDDSEFEDTDECSDVSAAEGAPAALTMSDNFFEPPCLAVSSTQTITLANAGNQLHNFSVGDADIDIDVEPGAEVETDELGTDLRAGTYEFVCEYHETQGMIGTLVVE